MFSTPLLSTAITPWTLTTRTNISTSQTPSTRSPPRSTPLPGTVTEPAMLVCNPWGLKAASANYRTRYHTVKIIATDLKWTRCTTTAMYRTPSPLSISPSHPPFTYHPQTPNPPWHRYSPRRPLSPPDRLALAYIYATGICGSSSISTPLK